MLVSWKEYTLVHRQATAIEPEGGAGLTVRSCKLYTNLNTPLAQRPAADLSSLKSMYPLLPIAESTLQFASLCQESVKNMCGDMHCVRLCPLQESLRTCRHCSAQCPEGWGLTSLLDAVATVQDFKDLLSKHSKHGITAQKNVMCKRNVFVCIKAWAMVIATSSQGHSLAWTAHFTQLWACLKVPASFCRVATFDKD